jgi:hypothetical protein
MLLTPHVAVGAAVGVATGNPILGFFAGFASHYVLDIIPHTDPGSFGVTATTLFQHRFAVVWAVIDAIVALGLLIFLAASNGYSLPLIFGAIGAGLPDTDMILYKLYPNLTKVAPTKQFYAFREAMHTTVINKKYIWAGILTQLVLIAAGLTYVFAR